MMSDDGTSRSAVSKSGMRRRFSTDCMIIAAQIKVKVIECTSSNSHTTTITDSGQQTCEPFFCGCEADRSARVVSVYLKARSLTFLTSPRRIQMPYPRAGSRHRPCREAHSSWLSSLSRHPSGLRALTQLI